MIKNRNFFKKSERGQVIVLVAAAFVGLVAAFGLMVDGGILLIEYGRLKRGIDAASVAAAAQFRKGYQTQDLINAGEELLKYNQSVATVTVQTCKGDGAGNDQDLTLCPASGEPARKLVRVTASRTVNFGFLPLIGIRSTTITANSVGEAASIDMVIALDTSSSMAYETTVGGNENLSDPGTASSPGDDPRVCNFTSAIPGRCEPMGTVKDVAKQFVSKMFFPYDRVALVTSASQTIGISGVAARDPVLLLPFNDNQDSAGVATTEIQDAIDNVKVLTPVNCDINYWNDPYAVDFTAPGPCLMDQDPTQYPGRYYGDLCFPYTFPPPYPDPPADPPNPGDPTTCAPSNIGGALNMAGDQFISARQEAYWVVIDLFGGPPNATTSHITNGPVNGFCPPEDWGLPGFCRDEDPTSSNRHYLVNGVYDPLYDADDFARDAADHVASPTKGQGATIFAICMGNPCQNYIASDYADRDSADRLGHYMAEQAGDDPSASPPVVANHGLYFYSQNSAGLTAIFDAIAANIFTRISQ